MWKILSDIDDILKEKHEEVIYDKDVEILREVNQQKEYFNQLISAYLRKYNIKIGELSKKDINLITKNYNDNQKDLFIQQVLYRLETNWWKPISRIKENNLSKLFDEND